MSRDAAPYPLVTIGLPVYNGGQYLAEALESVLAQDYPALEVIVSDNASTDDTESIARRYAERDPRVQYVRQAAHLDYVAHFERVRQRGRGKYFTWLAHDDLLSDVRYVSTVVAYLERHPDVVACTSGFYILSHELTGGIAAQDLPELYEERPWAEARRDFFIWPQNASSYAIYSMFRSDVLARTPMRPRRYRGSLNPAWWEMPVLSTLAGYGRIVALPTYLRTFRWLNTSAGWQTYQMAPAFDLFVLGLWTKLLLLRVALTVPLPMHQKYALVRTTLDNFFRANLSRPMDVPNLIAERYGEYVQLRQTARERAELIRSLVSQIERWRRTVPGSDEDESRWQALEREVQADQRIVEPDFDQLRQRVERFQATGPSVWAFFQRTPAWQLTLCEDVSTAVGSVRNLCDARVELVERLHAYGESIQDPFGQVAPPGDEEVRRVVAQIRTQLHEKDQVITELAASAEERLRLVEQLDTQLQEKDQLIAMLSDSAEERLRLLTEASNAAAQERQRCEALAAHIQEKEQALTTQIREQEQAVTAQIHGQEQALTAQLREKEQALAAHIREAELARERCEALTAQIEEKEQVIVELTEAANERLRLAHEASVEANRARVTAERLASELDQKEQIIIGLSAVAAERLSIIERLDQEAARDRS